MDDNRDNKLRKTHYNGIGHVPFPQASPTVQLREEQAFYEANSYDKGRFILCLAKQYRIVSKTVNRLLKIK
ncbi:MAG: hypothetical protein HWE24_20845 [Oceanospirillaceae bacterium]|nr:hypothetical protein [Oceanospirillaceae bacterium]